MSVKILEGDVLETLKDLPDCSVQCVVTSPPYYGLRDYGVDGQIGLEPSPEEYVEKLVQVFREVRRVLKDDGCVWLNLGDSYAGSGKGFMADGSVAAGKKQLTNKGSVEISESIVRSKRMARGAGRWGGGNIPATGNLKPKDLIGIPWMVAFALRADGWYLRSEIIWNKPNPMPESVRDRPTKAHEQIFLFSKSPVYFYDYEAILEPANYDGRKDTVMKGSRKYKDGSHPSNGNANSLSVKGRERWRFKNLQEGEACAVRNKRDVWTVATKPYKGAHFATFPPDLIEPCILAGSREGDTVLDPFCGSGTTLEVAIKHNRNGIGCELNPEYVRLAWRRLYGIQPYIPDSCPLQ